MIVELGESGCVISQTSDQWYQTIIYTIIIIIMIIMIIIIIIIWFSKQWWMTMKSKQCF